MGRMGASLFLVLFLAAHLCCGFSLSGTAPAFLWSPHLSGSSQADSKGVVSYRTILSKDLAKSVLSEGGWSNVVCSGEGVQQNVDIALVFIGRKLQSSDISKDNQVDPALLDFLKLSFSTSNFSMAFPYVTKSDDKESVENSVVSALISDCGHGLERSHFAISETCSVEGEDFTRLSDLHSVQEYMRSKAETMMKGQTDVIIFCSGNSERHSDVEAEGETLPGLVSFMESLGSRYSVLYVSDPHKQRQYLRQRAIDRFLVETTNGSVNSALCDGVCQIKSSLLEGIFVGIVLLIILLSGLCCMMGIDTPTRFETPQES